MERKPKKFPFRTSSIRLTANVPHEPFLDHFIMRNPHMAEFAADRSNIQLFNPEDYAGHDNESWNEISWLKDKPIFVLSQHDRIPPTFIWDAVNAQLCAAIDFTYRPEPLKSEGILMLRRLVYTGQKGHDHMRVEPAGTGKYANMEFEDVDVTPGTQDRFASEAEIEAQYADY